MPPLPGEERLVTLFADIHYYFQQPTPRPLRHRFDKGSYFYIYYNSTRHTSRIEIANNPGTPDQDAIQGYIEKSKVTNSQRFPTLVTMEVEAEGITTSPTSPVTKDWDEWRLNGGDLRDASGEKLKVHTMDIYFWAQDDARLAVDFFRKLLAPTQLDVGDQPTPRESSGTRSSDAVSPVVKNLEDVAISDPAYQNGHTANSRSKQHAIPVNLPPPPPLQKNSSRQSAQSSSPRTASEMSHSVTNEATYAPMAYNPAAPAAPEPIAHREKTPPPHDGADGVGLQHTIHDHSYQSNFTSTSPQSAAVGQHQSAHYAPYGSPPPPSASQLSHFGSPPPPSSSVPGWTPQPSSVGHTSSPSHGQAYSSTTSTALSFAPPPTNASSQEDPHRQSIAAQNYVPADTSHGQQDIETPSEKFYESLPQERRPLQHVQPRYQAEYFSPTSSAAYPQQAQSPPQNEYDVHSSVYRPTEAEQGGRPQHRPSKQSQSKPEGGSLKGFAKRFTTGVNKTIQKAESKYL